MGFPLGIMPDSDYQNTEVTLDPGDVVIALTDGIPDARNSCEELYGNERLITKLADANGGPKAVGNAIIDDVRAFSSGRGQTDDITLVSFGRIG